MTKRLWNELDKCARSTIRYPGPEPTYRGIKSKNDGHLPQMRIPSGRTLCCGPPEIAVAEKTWGPTEVIQYLDNTGEKKVLYGGKLTENLTQTTARDLLANAIFNVERHGYCIVNPTLRGG